MDGICWIVGAGAFTPRGLEPREGDYIIAADGGYASLIGAGLLPDLLLGDFDSLTMPLPEGVQILRHPIEKDDTDMGLALKEGYKRGYRRIMLYGGGGGRMDHTIANIQLMCDMSRRGCTVRLVDDSYDIFTVTDGCLCLPERRRGTIVSVFCNGDSASGVTLERLKYPLDNATLTCDMPLGVSNEYAEDGEARVSVEKGTLFVIVGR